MKSQLTFHHAGNEMQSAECRVQNPDCRMQHARRGRISRASRIAHRVLPVLALAMGCAGAFAQEATRAQDQMQRAQQLIEVAPQVQTAPMQQAPTTQNAPVPSYEMREPGAPPPPGAAGKNAPPRPVKNLPLPEDFAIFKTRNAFAHGKGQGGPGGPGGPKGPEAGLVFRGAVDEVDHVTAFVEDTASKRVMELAAGAMLASGKIKSVDLDTLVYESPAGSKRIQVGQNLDGQVVPPTPAAKPAGPQPQPGGPGGPQGQMPPGQPGPMPPGQPAPARAVRTAPVTKAG